MSMLNNNVPVAEESLTLGSLFKQDLPDANLLPFYPSSFNSVFRFLNKEQYRIFNIPKAANNSKRFLVPLRNCCVAGNELPILVHELPNESLSAHWKKWCKPFIEPVIKTVEEGLQDDKMCITQFPLEAIPKEKHAVEPEMYYEILKKSAIPDAGAPYPTYYDKTNIEMIEFPCMIKIDQSLSGYGNYVVQNREEFGDRLKWIMDRFGSDASYVISQYIQDVQSTLDCGFYVTKTGEIKYIGVQECVLIDFGYDAGSIDWDMQGKYRERVYDKFVVPVANYLHTKGYFGIVGIDIITSPGGDYLVDLNPRINGNTAYLILASSMAKLGLTKSRYEICKNCEFTSQQLVNNANSINEKNLSDRIIIMAAVNDGEKCYASFAVFSNSVEMVNSLFDELCQK